MKKNNSRQNFLQQIGACALVIGSLALAGDGDAATATGTATATVVESVSISISAPTTLVLSGTIVTIEGFVGSLSLSGPLLRFGSTPPPGAPVTAAQSGSTGAGAAPSNVNSATVTVMLQGGGSLTINGIAGLAFTVSQPSDGVINIEYN